MCGRNVKPRGLLFLFFVGLVLMVMSASVPALAGSAAIGSAAGSVNTTMAGQPLLSNSVIFSGDSLEVKQGAAVIVLSGGSRLVLGRETGASFLREGNEVTVVLGRGAVSVYHPGWGGELRVKVNDLSIVPAKGFKTLGEVAMLDGGVVVASREGLLRVEGNGPPVEVAKGRVVTLRPRTARAPQGAPAGATPGNGNTRILTMAALGVGTLGAVVSFVGLSHANDASDSAATANRTAAAAADAAAAAATAAASATNLASAILQTSLAETNVVGCELNALANSEGKASPYTPPSGFTCP